MHPKRLRAIRWQRLLRQVQIRACAGMREHRENLNLRLRTGGSADTMESLHQERRRTDKRLGDLKC